MGWNTYTLGVDAGASYFVSGEANLGFGFRSDKSTVFYEGVEVKAEFGSGGAAPGVDGGLEFGVWKDTKPTELGGSYWVVTLFGAAQLPKKIPAGFVGTVSVALSMDPNPEVLGIIVNYAAGTVSGVEAGFEAGIGGTRTEKL